MYDKYELLDLGDINDIKTFNKRFWKADSADNDFSFVVKFDLQKGEFSNKSDNGIKLEGLPYHCWVIDCIERQGLKLYVSDNYELQNDDLEFISDDRAKDLIKQNILNHGQDPSLSDSPEKAITNLFLTPDHKIEKLNKVFKVIADSYADIIESKRKETGKTEKQLITEFPFRLHLRLNMRQSGPIQDIIPDTWEGGEIDADELDSLVKSEF